MPKVQVEVEVNEDGTVDIAQWGGEHQLAPVKKLIDGLRKENADHRKKVETSEQERTRTAQERDELQTRIKDLEGKANMTDQERKEYEAAQKRLEKLGIKGDEDVDRVLGEAQYGSTRKRQDALTEAAKLSGFKPETFLKLAGIEAADISIVDEKVKENGKETVQRKAVVKVGNDTLDLKAWVEKEHADFLPVLSASTQKPNNPTLPGLPNNPNPPSTTDGLAGAIAEFYR